MKLTSTSILIVEDDPNDRDILQLAIKGLDLPHKVVCVSSGNEAIRYLNGTGQFSDRNRYPYPGYIFTDLKMPDGDGFALLDNLKSNPDWAVIPTIVLSNSADKDDVKTAFLLGASSYFVKPAFLHDYRRMMKVIFDYWNISHVPEVDAYGQQEDTEREGKLGARFSRAPYRMRRRDGGPGPNAPVSERPHGGSAKHLRLTREGEGVRDE